MNRNFKPISQVRSASIMAFGLVISWLMASPLLGISPAEPVTQCVDLRCEYLVNPNGIDTRTPRLSWRIEALQRGYRQTAYQIQVASSGVALAQNQADLWDSGKVVTDQTAHIAYQGPVASGQRLYWRVRSWDQNQVSGPWSQPASWTMGILDPTEWSANFISYRDPSAVFKDRQAHFLPAARFYRKPVQVAKQVKQATAYVTALGIYDFHLNGKRVSDRYFAPGWTDYRRRVYYQTYDVTEQLQNGENCLGLTVADGWYSGYVGFGLLVGIGTEQIGRYTYGKTPAAMLQMEIEYQDGSKERIVTDRSWKVTDQGPYRQADLLMGEFYDATQELPGWSQPGFDDSKWDSAILATENGPQPAEFYEFKNPTDPNRGPQIQPTPIDLGFRRPKLESYPAEPVQMTEEIQPVEVVDRGNGTFIFNLGQNFAGNVRIKLKGPAGHQVKIRYAEMLHPDGRMMTENLRKARATDYYVCKGAPNGETYSPRFTFHGFQYVEVSNFPGTATKESLTGLVIHSNTRLTSEFSCSDPMVNQLFKNIVWTQRANFIELPTDCPQRDERMGWTGDAQAYVATATYNADVGAFFTKWNRELMESQRPSGAFPGYAPFPFQHGWDFGSAWADAGVICPWTIWQAYGDRRVIDDCWEPMTRFMEWRKRTSRNDLGVTHGNAWGDWLSQGEETPLDFVDTVYFAISTRMMAEMAEATGRNAAAVQYRNQLGKIQLAFVRKYLSSDGRISEEGRLSVKTQTAYALALEYNLIPEQFREAAASQLAEMIAERGNHMATGFLGTRVLLPALTSAGQNDLAVFLLQSREFPSWGYEVEQGATTIWERWDSFTKEDGFGRHNAAMNSFSHYAFGAVCEWMFRSLAGIEAAEPGYRVIRIRPQPPRPASNAQQEPIDWVKASYDSIKGMIRSEWKLEGERFNLVLEIPANTTARVYLPTDQASSITESGKPLDQVDQVAAMGTENGFVKLFVPSGRYHFSAAHNLARAKVALATSKPKDTSLNPEEIDLELLQKTVTWDFRKAADVDRWTANASLEIKRTAEVTTLEAVGADSQMMVRLDQPLQGPLVVELRGRPVNGSTSQFFWATTDGPFSATRQTVKRRLNPSDQTNSCLFSIPATGRVTQLRFDPFFQFEAYANRGRMEIESLSIYQPKDVPQQSNEPAKGASKQTQAKPLPNVLFFLAEDQGAHLSSLGTAGLRTPNIDRLASQGVYFKNAFVAYPVCSASKAAMYTGLHCHTNGVLNNTHNFHKPAGEVTPAERNLRLAKINRIKQRFTTLTELLKRNGYRQAVTHKLHVLPNEKFPYDRFLGEDQRQINQFIENGAKQSKPWFMLVNMPYSHRPYPNRDRVEVRVNPDEVKLPSYLPETPEVRKDWSEYLGGIERVDAVVGRTLQALQASGQRQDTIVVYYSDHGPTFPHGKMTLHDLGLRVPLIISAAGIARRQDDALVSGVDLVPTLIDMIEQRSATRLTIDDESESKQSDQAASWKARFGYPLHGVSLANRLRDPTVAAPRQYVFAEVSNRGPLPNNGIQERCVTDGRWKLIVRSNVEKRWRQVNADSRQFKTWGNRSYAETIRVKDQFPEAYRVLQEMDPQTLGGQVPEVEFYDLVNDPDEMQNLYLNKMKPDVSGHLGRLKQALIDWMEKTGDTSMQSRHLAKVD